MNEKEIQRLIQLVENSSIGELEVSRWGKKVRISKFPTATYPAVQPPAVQPPPPQPAANLHVTVPATPEVTQSQPLPQPQPIVAKPAPAAPAPPVEQKTSGLIEIKSPMVGTFYRAPSPDSDPYVEVGDVIAPGQVLCIIEAMKLMNEIEAEVNGRIVEILVENTQPVEYNQVLFRVENQ